MMKRIVKMAAVMAGITVTLATFASTPVDKALKQSASNSIAASTQAHAAVSQLPTLMPGPVIVSNHHIPIRSIGPVVLTPKERHVVSSDDPYVKVNLPVHAGAGEHWEIAYCDDNLIGVIGEKQLGPVSEVVGAPGQTIFTFKALKPELNAARTTHILLRLVAADGHTVQYVNVLVSSTGA